MATLNDLLSLWRRLPAYREFVDGLEAGQSGEASGLSGSLPVMLAAALIQDLDRPAVLVTVGLSEARRTEAELSYYLPERPIHLIPPFPHVTGELEAETQEWGQRRVAALECAARDPRAILVVPAEAARQLLAPPNLVDPVRLVPGAQMAPEAVKAALGRLGYTRVDEVADEGQFAARGAIVDVFVPGGPCVRIEWIDEDVDSLRAIDPETQRTVQALTAVTIGPARELLIADAAKIRGVSRIAEESNDLIANLAAAGQGDVADRARERYGRILHHLNDRGRFPGLERYRAAFFDLLPLPQVFLVPPVILFDDLPRIGEVLKGLDAADGEERLRLWERGDWLPVEAETVLAADAFFTRFRGFCEVSLSLMPHHRPGLGRHLRLTGRPAPRVHGDAHLLTTELARLSKARMRVAIVLGHGDAHTVMRNQLTEAGLPVRPGLGEPGEIGLLTGRIGPGFVLPELALALIGETELAGRTVRVDSMRRRRVRRFREGEFKPGDLIVHHAHGIGRFVGIKTLVIQDQHKDYLHVEYAGGDALYVPVDQLGLVQRYVGVEGQDPKLSKMGGGEWARAKDKVRASVREMAEALLKLYAAREARPGLAAAPDTPWQADFEAAFPYEETADQLRAIQEIKWDMEKTRPMDRLLCGDVGYGKTEVALRAAFKAIMSGRQVAFLVPTTLLAEQHYATAKTRLAGYPVRVEVLSRFRSAAQQRAILADLAAGRIDLLIGTHRLLGKDVRFADLGLLVVDEEHRFGVGHKERIKALKENVDVLTLSATPIPRTLHMAMTGIRDMSVIETPPEDRLPVETVVAEYDEDLVREAIRREVDRGGQVFYVQNRIFALDGVVARLQAMFPRIRVGVVHGRMEESQVEDVMARFIEREYDVLVATSIIESGLDIPNANTLVVEDADRLGLAQLYQLRGRVGRSSRLAYAYFTYRRDKMLTPEAERRLETIREFTELGAGYQIALRDLEIRGSGNLLGAEQHGFVASVGLDLYTDMLRQAIAELKGEAAEVPPDPAIEIPVDGYLPDAYVAEPRHKIELYKRLVSARNLTEVEDLVEEMEDRFGPLPGPVATLVGVSRCRVMARELRLTGVAAKADRIVLTGAPDTPIGTDAVKSLATLYPGRLVPGVGRAPELGIKLPPRSSAGQILDLAVNVLGVLRETIHGVPQESG